MSLSIEDVLSTLKAAQLPPAVLVKIESDLEQIEADKKADAEAAPPKIRSQLVVILLDPDGKAPEAANLTALVVSMPENQDTGETLPRLYQSVYDQRAAAKRRTKAPILTLGDAASGLKARFSKPHSVSIKSRQPVRVIVAPNDIPTA